MLDWSTIDTVFLDMDGTLLDLRFDNHFWREHLPTHYAEHHGLDLGEAAARLEAAYDEVAGTLDWYCLDYWSRRLGIDVIALKEAARDRIRLRPHCHALLDGLAQIGKRRVLLSNAHPESLRIKMEQTGLAARFEAIVSTHVIGLAKEAPGFWERLQDIEPFSAPRTLLIDDSPAILSRAAEAGIGHLLAIARPDSSLPAVADAGFPLIEDFHEIVPKS